MGQVIWTEHAKQWLEDIFNYIALDNPAAALRTVEGIYKKAGLLSQFPELGARFESDDPREVRILLFGHYRIAYHVRSSREVVILGVFHSALDIDRLL